MPLAIAGLALMAGGTAMSIAGNKQSQNAMNATRSAFTAKNADLENQANDIAQSSIASSSPQDAQTALDAGAAGRTSAFNNLQDATAPIASALPAAGTGTATGQAQKDAAATTSAWNRLVTGAGARMGSYSDWQTQEAIKNADASQRLGVINNFASGNANLLPIEMNVASQKGDKLSGWGQLVSALGSMTSLAGATGAFAPASGALPTAAQSADLAAGAGPVSATYAATNPVWSTAAAAAAPNPWATAF